MHSNPTHRPHRPDASPDRKIVSISFANKAFAAAAAVTLSVVTISHVVVVPPEASAAAGASIGISLTDISGKPATVAA